jgi:hypothetical protein
VKFAPLEATPETVTTTFPVLAPIGTNVPMLVAVHPVTAAVVPLNVTVLLPCEDPKFVPVIVTGVPAAPLLILKLEIVGDVPPTVTVKFTPLEATPDTVTTTFPVLAPIGTDVPMLVAVHTVTAAVIPLNATVLPPCVDPKFVPVIVTGVATAPLLTLRPDMTGDVLPPPDLANAMIPTTASAVELDIVHVAVTAPPPPCV